jgi:DNA end-binding protein Ku
MRSIWNGSIAFGLVNIPVKLYAAVDSQRVSFKLLCKPCMTPVRYERYCEGCKEQIEWSDTVKALDLGGGNYLPFSREELDEIKPEKTNRIEIEEIIDGENIDPIQYNKPYFCAPSTGKDRSYHLFKRVLEDSGKVAVGRFVMREKEYVCAIRPFKKGLLLSTLHYAFEIRDIDTLDTLADAPSLKKDEVQLAEKLVDQLYEKEFNIDHFKDRFAEQLKAMIESKDKITIERTESDEPVFDESSLMEALKASLN